MVLLFALISCTQAYDLFWRDQKTGAEFDWSDLQREQDDPYEITDTEYQYGKLTFNIGYVLGEVCGKDNPAVLSEFTQNGYTTCRDMGHHGVRRIGMIEQENPFAGFRMTYLRGDKCEKPNDSFYGEQMQTRFVIKCDEKKTDIDWKVRNLGSDWKLELELKHKVGCPTDFYGGLFGSYAISFGSAVLICIIGAVILYFIVEMCNKLWKPSDSEEAQDSRWVALADLVKDGVTYSYKKVKNAFSPDTQQYDNL